MKDQSVLEILRGVRDTFDAEHEAKEEKLPEGIAANVLDNHSGFSGPGFEPGGHRGLQLMTSYTP